MSQFKLYNGDCLDVLRKCPADYFDSIVTDPPYGLRFMGKKWDYDVPSVDVWRECLRVLKPGGHLLAFGGTRTYHRLVVAIEDAGFEIRDQIQWIYGQGFPKSQDISKAIDKAAGAEREVLGRHPNAASSLGNGINMEGGKAQDDVFITAPATDDAKKWSGWGTALKPANEPICLARKPLSETTIAKNVLKYGTGGLNIDGTRIETGGKIQKRPPPSGNPVPGNHTDRGPSKDSWRDGAGWANSWESNPAGRFPSNVILDEDAAKVLDEQSGIAKPKPGRTGRIGGQQGNVYGDYNPEAIGTWPADPGGGASRFFYVAKASKSDRGEGNTHPTVKPIKLMEYLIKLVTPEGGKVLDPFMGSGTTGVAALRNGFEFRGIEMSNEYYEIATKRIGETNVV